MKETRKITELKKRIEQIFDKIPNEEVGAVERPSAEQLWYQEHPQAKAEQKAAEADFDNVIQRTNDMPPIGAQE